MTINELLYHQDRLFSLATSRWIDWCNLFGDNRESDGTSQGWEVSAYLSPEERELWQEIQRQIRKAQDQNREKAKN